MTLMQSKIDLWIAHHIQPVPESSFLKALAGLSEREPIQTRPHRTVIVGLPFFSSLSSLDTLTHSHLTSLCNRGCYSNTTAASPHNRGCYINTNTTVCIYLVIGVEPVTSLAARGIASKKTTKLTKLTKLTTITIDTTYHLFTSFYFISLLLKSFLARA